MYRIFVAMLAMGLMLISAAGAQPQGGMMMAVEELGLSNDQIAKIDDLMLQHQKQMIDLKAGAKKAKLELRAMMKEAKVDEKAALARQDEISKLKAQMANAKLKHMLAMRNILTAEQLDKWMKMQRMHQGFREKGGKRQSGGCMPGCKPPMGPGMGGPGMGMGHGDDK